MEYKYKEEDMLLLSGIQHFAFCERQWALAHIEQMWAENVYTVEGHHLHERVDDPFADETRNGLRIVRAMPLASMRLGLRGIADVVEFYQQDEKPDGSCCRLEGREGWWTPAPVEYKRGHPKPDDRDAVQLCAQAMALEEMLEVVIEKGYLFYGQIKRRETIYFEACLRNHTIEIAERMHQLFAEGITPGAQDGKKCKFCSMKELCQPEWTLKHRSVDKYLKKMSRMEVEET